MIKTILFVFAVATTTWLACPDVHLADVEVSVGVDEAHALNNPLQLPGFGGGGGGFASGPCEGKMPKCFRRDHCGQDASGKYTCPKADWCTGGDTCVIEMDNEGNGFCFVAGSCDSSGTSGIAAALW